MKIVFPGEVKDVLTFNSMLHLNYKGYVRIFLLEVPYKDYEKIDNKKEIIWQEDQVWYGKGVVYFNNNLTFEILNE